MEIFSALLAICAGNSPVWVNNGEAGDLRRHRAHYDVIVMVWAVSTTEAKVRYDTDKDREDLSHNIAPLGHNEWINLLWPSGGRGQGTGVGNGLSLLKSGRFGWGWGGGGGGGVLLLL